MCIQYCKQYCVRFIKIIGFSIRQMCALSNEGTAFYKEDLDFDGFFIRQMCALSKEGTAFYKEDHLFDGFS